MTHEGCLAVNNCFSLMHTHHVVADDDSATGGLGSSQYIPFLPQSTDHTETGDI